jgi:hypothetical protein
MKFIPINSNKQRAYIIPFIKDAFIVSFGIGKTRPL